jgi:hypothetical protein
MTHPLDDIAPLIAKWLAPYVAAELDLANPRPRPALSPDYDDATCLEYLGGIGDAVLPRAELFFRALAEKAATDQPGLESRELAKLLGVDSPRQIPSLLTNSLKRRAKALGLPKPWEERATRENRTLWVDRDGIAHRMLGVLWIDEGDRRIPAILDEHGQPLPRPADNVGGPHPAERLNELSHKDVLET